MYRSEIPPYDYLIIDDDEFTMECLRLLLEKMGAKSIHCEPDGVDVIQNLESAGTMPDIMICDLNMPEVDGVQLILQLAKKKFSGGIILISGTSPGLLDVAMNLATAHSLNVLGTLEKPISRDVLHATICRYQS